MQDIPIVYGDDCLLGFDADKTPKYIYVRFSLIVQCPSWNGAEHTTPPNDRVFKMEQVNGIPCRWEYFGAEWFIQFTISSDPFGTVIFLVNNDDGATYFGDITDYIPEEGYVYPNDITFCEPWYGGAEGFAVLSWTPQATALLKAINLAKGYDLFMELFPREDGKLVYKFCKLQDATNVKILFEP